jgi:hypothetical protein
MHTIVHSTVELPTTNKRQPIFGDILLRFIVLTSHTHDESHRRPPLNGIGGRASKANLRRLVETMGFGHYQQYLVPVLSLVLSTSDFYLRPKGGRVQHFRFQWGWLDSKSKYTQYSIKQHDWDVKYHFRLEKAISIKK